MSEIVDLDQTEVVARAIHGATDNPVLPYDYDGEIGEEWRDIHRKQAGAAILALFQSARPVAIEGEAKQQIAKLDSALRISLWNEARGRGMTQDAALQYVRDKVAAVYAADAIATLQHKEADHG